MVDGDIIDRENKLVFVDNNEETYSFNKIGESILELNEEAPDDVINHIAQYSKYKFEEDLEYPLTVSTSHHLEDTVGSELEYEYGEKLETLVGQGKIDLPSIEVHENWKVYENGNAELVSVEYNGQEYTVD
jgi:hypothetical protein